MKDAYEIYTVFWGFAVFSFLGLAFMLAVLPETKGKSFACIQAHLRREVAKDNAKKLATVEYWERDCGEQNISLRLALSLKDQV